MRHALIRRNLRLDISVALTGVLLLGACTSSPPAPDAAGQPTKPPAVQTTLEAEVQRGDVHGWDILATVTNSQPEHRGAANLASTVTVHTDTGDGSNLVASYCISADPHVWMVITGSGVSNIGPCTSESASLDPFWDIPPSTRPAPNSARHVRMYVTWVSRARELDACYHGDGDQDCMTLFGPFEPTPHTGARFGFRIYEHRAQRRVLSLWNDHAFEALTTIRGKAWLTDRAVVAAPDASRVAVTLPDSRHRRVVGLFTSDGPHLNTCIELHETELPPLEPFHAYERAVHEECGVDLRMLADGEFRQPLPPSEISLEYGDPWMFVAPGAPRVTVDITRGDPRNIRFAVVVWEPRRQALPETSAH